MTIISATPGGSGDPSCAARCKPADGVRKQRSLRSGGAHSRRRKAEFQWDARVQEHYLGQHLLADPGDDESDEERAPIAILTFLAGRWHAGICLVDGSGCVVDLLWLRSFDARADAAETFARAR